MNGVLLVDKPAGMTSHDVVGRVRRLAGQRRVGHSGTLDPAATGLLILCLGRATRLVEYLVGRPKTYLGRVTFGVETSSYDADGEIVSQKPVPPLTADLIESMLEPLRGDIMQVPPMVSALKRDGKRLYELARQGVEVERPPRPVTIYRLEQRLLTPPHLDIEVECSAGTYIRSIAYDLGVALGCGAHLSGLRRTRVGDFQVEQAVALDDLPTDQPEAVAARLLPPAVAIAHLPRIDLTADAARDLGHGKWVLRDDGAAEAELVAAFDQTGDFVGLLTAHDRFWKPKKMFKIE